MPAYLGSSQIDKCYLGSQEISKVMLGTHEVCSSGSPPCTPLPAPADEFLREYISNDEAAATARDPHGVFPHGPVMPLSFYSINDSLSSINYAPLEGRVSPTSSQAMADEGLTFAGPGYGSGGCRLELGDPEWGTDHCSVDTGPPGNSAWVNSHNIKAAYHIRPVPKGSGASNTDTWAKLRRAMGSSDGRATIRHVIRTCVEDGVANYNDVTAMWHLGIDDYESPADKNFFDLAVEVINQYDPLKRPFTGTCKGDVSLGNIKGIAKFVPAIGVQHYVLGYDGYTYHWESNNLPLPNPGGSYDNSDDFRWWMAQYRSHCPIVVKAMVDGIREAGANHGGSHPTYTGRESAIFTALECYSNPRFSDGAHGNESRWIDWTPKVIRHDFWSSFAAGAQGLFVNSWNYDAGSAAVPGRARNTDYMLEHCKIMTDSGMDRALLWGQDKGAGTIVHVSGRTTCPMGWGPNSLNENASSYFHRNIQHGNDRFILVTNSHPVDTVVVDLKDVGLTGLQVVDLLDSDTIVPVSGNDLRVSIPKISVILYKVVAADGYCGGDVPQPAPHITLHPVGGTFAIGAATPVFTVGYTPANAHVQWQWRNTVQGINPVQTFADIPGATSATYHMTATHFVSAHNHDEFRAQVSTSGNPTATSNIAHITVTGG